MKLSNATEIAERMLQTCFSTWYEIKQAEICVYMLLNFSKIPTIYRQKQDLPTELFPGGVTPPCLSRDGPDRTYRGIPWHF